MTNQVKNWSVETIGADLIPHVEEFSIRNKAIAFATHRSLMGDFTMVYYKGESVPKEKWVAYLMGSFGGVQLDLETKEYTTFTTMR